MKVNKKFLASFMTLTMAISPMTAFATPGTNYNGSADSITGIGTVTTIDTEIYNIVLPTDESIAFDVDPYGVLALSNSNTQESLKDVLSKAAGTVTSKATAVINKSSVAIDVKMEAYLDSTQASNGAVKLASSYAEAKDGDKDLYLTITNLSGAALDGVATGEAVTLTGFAAANAAKPEIFTLSDQALQLSSAVATVSRAGITVTATGAASTTTTNSVKSFTLGDISEAYVVSRAQVFLDESKVPYNSKNVYAFVIDGYAKPGASVWQDISDSDGELELTLKFTISKAAEAEAEPEPEPEPTDDFVMTANANGSVSYTFVDAPTGSLTAITVDSTNRTGQITSGNINYSNGTLTINSSGVSTCGLNATGSHTIVVTIGGTNYTLTYTK